MPCLNNNVWLGFYFVILGPSLLFSLSLYHPFIFSRHIVLNAVLRVYSLHNHLPPLPQQTFALPKDYTPRTTARVRG